MLSIENLRVFHGPIEAVHGISFHVAQGQCVALLGPNGAGKTSTISAITGIAKSNGTIRFEGREIGSLPVESRIRAGISVSPEGRRIFSNLTVAENLTLGGATPMAKRQISPAGSKPFRSWASGTTSPQARFRAGISKCWPSLAR